MATKDTTDPAPFPIKISYEQARPSSEAESSDESIPEGKRIDNFYPAWEKFLALETKRAKKTNRIARNVVAEKARVARTSRGEGLEIRENAAKSYDQAATECRAKVKAIVAECKRLNKKYHDVSFDLTSYQLWCLRNLAGELPEFWQKCGLPGGSKRIEDLFDEPRFIVGGATAEDIHQGIGGDCWFLAALTAVSAKKELIERLCIANDEKIGVYGFVFYRDGEWIYEVIDDRLYTLLGNDPHLTIVHNWERRDREGTSVYYDDEKLKALVLRGGKALYFSHCNSNETWVPLIEKAYAKAHGDYAAIEGGWAAEGIEDITGGVSAIVLTEDIMDKDLFWREQLLKVNDKYLFGGGSRRSASKGFVSGHAYTVLRAWEEGDLRLVKLRNPWGDTEWKGDWADGSKLWTPEMMTKLEHEFGDDGIFWISYKDFLNHVPHISRVRLFDSSWSVAQKWTSVNVPWTVDYLDTKFQFTLSKQCPVVIVLCQPDSRYFMGLAGRFTYSLHFRLYHKDGVHHGYERWIVRSMHSSGIAPDSTRSVSAEVEDLEPGTYDVVVKITPQRYDNKMTAHESIAKYAVERKEKLLSVGRRFDYAQSKGNLKGLEEANRRASKKEARAREREQLVLTRKINQLERKRAQLRRKRIDNAMKALRKDYDTKMKEYGKKKAEAKKLRKEAKDAVAGSQSKSTGPPTADVSQGGKTGDPETAPSMQEEKPKSSALATKLATLAMTSAAENVNPTTDENQAQQQGEKELSAEAKPVSGSEEKTQGDATAAMKSTSVSNAEGKKLDAEKGVDEESDVDIGEDPPTPPPETLEDYDFDWDDQIDAPVTLADIGVDQGRPDPIVDEIEASTRNEVRKILRRGADDPIDTDDQHNKDDDVDARSESEDEAEDLKIFGDDPWQAMCVLGLRVYSQQPDAVDIDIVREGILSE